MKPIFVIKENQALIEPFSVRYIDDPHTGKKYHYHEEYEIQYNLDSSGVRGIGDSIERYSNHDLVFIGQNIPHFWHCDDKPLSNDQDHKPRAVIIHFKKDLFSNVINNFPEFKSLDNLLALSNRGIHFHGLDARVIGNKILSLTRLCGWKRLLVFIEILLQMCDTDNYRLLASTDSNNLQKNDYNEKIYKILNYMIDNYNRELTLEETASCASMSVSAFCRYFKKHTGKTFSQVLNEIRIGFACKSLIYTENSVSEIAYNSGFNNVPYFNRLFKRLKEVTPVEFRQKHLKMMA